MRPLSRSSQPSPPRSRLPRYAVCAALLVGLAACSGTSGSAATSSRAQPSSPAPGPTGSASTTAHGRTIRVTVTGSTVTPAPAVVDLPIGETLTLVVTSDHDDRLHAHGFEVVADLKAGVPTKVSLTGRDPGRFDIETHRPALTLLTVAVR